MAVAVHCQRTNLPRIRGILSRCWVDMMIYWTRRRWRLSRSGEIGSWTSYEKEDGLWPTWVATEGKALRVTNGGLNIQGEKEYMEEENGGRRRKLLEIVEREKGAEGWDYAWESCCRSWLDSG